MMERLLLPAALVVAILIVYAPVRQHAFTLDAAPLVRDDPRVRNLDLGAILTTDYWNLPEDPARAETRPGLYRPVTLIVLGLLRALTSDEDLRANRSPPVNLGNLAFHVAGVLLRYALFLALLRGRAQARWLAFLAALWLGVHPIATEACATQVGASEGLSTAFGTASLLAFLRWHRDRRLAALLAHSGFLLLAFFSKENLVVLPALVFLIAWLPERQTLKTALVRTLPSLLAVAVGLGLRFAVLGQIAGVGDPTYEGFPTAIRIVTALAVIAVYDVPALFWPARLHPNLTFQDVPPASGFGDPRALLGAAIVIGFIATAVLVARRDRIASLGLAWFGVALFPVSNLVIPIGALAATRFLYFPATGLALALAAALGRLAAAAFPGARLAAAAIALALVASAFGFGRAEAGIWTSDPELVRATIDRYPGSTWAHHNLGVALIARGDLDGAYAHFARAASLPRHGIPGTGLVSEDLLDLAFQAAMNAGFCRLQAVQLLGARPSPEAANPLVDDALRWFGMAEQIARDGAAQAPRRRVVTAWTPLAADALVAQAQAHAVRPGGGRHGAGSSLDAATRAVQQALALAPESLRARLFALRLDRARGLVVESDRTLESLNAEARSRFATDAAAREIAFELADRLQARGATERSLVLRLEALMAGDTAVDARQLYDPAIAALATASPELRAQGRRALERFVERVDPRIDRRVADARKRLESLGR